MPTAELTVRRVKDKRELKQFVRFNYEMYKNCPYAIPDLLEDTLDTFDAKTNAAFEFCKAEWFMAFRGDELVGKVVAIINDRANTKWDIKAVRFGWIDFIDDQEVSKALINAVEEWGRNQGMDTIVGPLGFTDLDREGMLFEGFEHLGTMPTIYNYAYYNTHMEALGFEEEAIWVDRTIKVPEAGNEGEVSKFFRVADIVSKRNGFHIRKFKDKNELKKSGYIKKIFDIVNTAYSNLYGYSQMSQKQIDQYANTYLSYLDIRLISVVENKDNEPIAFGVCMPDISIAVQKAKAKMWPFGWWHLAKALFWKHSDIVDLLLIGTLPEYQDSGAISIVFSDLIPQIQKMGFKVAECCPQLETNNRAISIWKSFDSKVNKRRHTWKKKI